MRTLFTAVFLSCALVATGLSQDVPKVPTIQVTGTAEISVMPDEVTLSLSVTKTSKDLNVAKREVDAALSKINEIIRRYSISPSDYRTDYISVQMKYQSIRDPKAPRVYNDDGEEIGNRVFLGYEVSTTVGVKLKDLTKFTPFFSDMFTTGVTEISDVKFLSSKIISERANARELAMKAAYEKATAMAAAINQKIGKAIYIAEGTGSRPLYVSGGVLNSNATANYSGNAATSSESLATFSPGAIKVSADVSVIFLLD